MFLGELVLVVAVVLWAIALLMSPHGPETVDGAEFIRATVVTFVRNSAVGTLALSAFAGWLLFPNRRPRKPVRDWSILAILAILVATSLYQLVWLRSVSA